MVTKKQLVDDIILRISEGKPSDDLELEPLQVAFWIDEVLNALVKNTLDKNLINNIPIDPVYIHTEYEKQPIAVANGLITVQLDHTPFNLYRDRGIIRVITSDGEYVDKVRIEDIDTLTHLKFSRPTVRNIKYVRHKNGLRIYGLPLGLADTITFGVTYTPQIPFITKMDDGDIVHITEDILPLVSESVSQIAIKQMGINNDVENDGTQNPVQPK